MTGKPTTEEIIARLDGYARRLYKSVIQATSLHAAFRSLNESEELPKMLFGRPVAHAANIIQHALLRELILVVVRLLDKPRKLETSDKVSFVVVRLWLERDQVREALLEQARTRHGEKWERRNVRITQRAIQSILKRLDRLAAEEPNRERLLRNFRDDFLAHDLHREIPRDQPLFRHIMEMVEEVQALCLDTLIACTGFELSFDHIADEARDAMDQLWIAVAKSAKA